LGTEIFNADIYCRCCQRLFSINLADLTEDNPLICPHCHSRITAGQLPETGLPESCLDEVLDHIKTIVDAR